ncbi:hypothetical protein JOE11_004902 [Robbsia andropogonis]
MATRSARAYLDISEELHYQDSAPESNRMEQNKPQAISGNMVITPSLENV